MKRSEMSCIPRFVIGEIVVSRTSGRRMEYLGLACHGEGPLIRLRPAKGDVEYHQWKRQETSVLWPPTWVWGMGDQIEFVFR